ncbi:MAG: hypothetical protein ABI584_14350 [Acidobacteriota bacterium]
MPKGLRRCVGLSMLVVAGLFFAGCSSMGKASSTGPLLSAKRQKVLLVVRHSLFSKKAQAYPERIVIPGYGDGSTAREIKWSYIHKSTTITFEEKVIGVVACNDDDGECTLKLKGDLLKGAVKRVFKYTVKGEDDDGKLDDNDPEVEIDR